MLTLTLAVALSVLGASLPNIALPSIAQALQVSPAASVWVINAYQIVVTVSLLPFSSLGDIHGYRRVYGFGIVLFTLASGLCALAPDLETLVAARILQGIGSAGIMSVNTALVRTIFPRAELGRGMGLNTMVVATSLALGPTTSAAVLALADWHWLFLVNVPLGLVAMATWRFLPATPPGAHRFDIPSALLNAATLGLFIAGLDWFGHGTAVVPGLLLLAAALVVGWVFVKRQLALAAPMLPVDLFRRPAFALAVATSICSYMGQTTAYVALPFLFHAGGASEIGTGLLMTPWPVAVMIVSPFAGRLSDRFPAGLLGGIGLGRDDGGAGGDRDAGARRAVVGRGVAHGAHRRRLRPVPDAEQPRADLLRAAGAQRAGQRHDLHLPPAGADHGRGRGGTGVRRAAASRRGHGGGGGGAVRRGAHLRGHAAEPGAAARVGRPATGQGA